MATFVLVPGGWKGSWAYDAFVPRDGGSWWSVANAYFQEMIAAGAASTGHDAMREAPEAVAVLLLDE